MQSTTIRAFEDELVALIRALGLHRPDTTPCGYPISVAEAHAILELSRDPGISQNGLATKLGLEKSTVSRVAALLEKRGWLDRVRDRGDSRVLQLKLTPAGAKVARTLAASRTKKFRQAFEAIPASQRIGVLKALAVLSQTLSEGTTS